MPLVHASRSLQRCRAIITLVLLFALAAVVLQQPPSARADDDGCDPDEPIACLPLPPDEPVAPAPAGPSAAAAAPIPLPLPCLPFRVPQGAPAAAAPIPPFPPGCGVRDAIVAVNRANGVYARALRTLDPSVLPPLWQDSALANLQGQIAWLRGEGRYATVQLLSITLLDITPRPGAITIHTIEHWTYQERSRRSGRVLLDLDEWADNVYSLALRPRGWAVVQDDITLAGPPPFTPPVPVPAPFPAPISAGDDSSLTAR
jgi:hypothetical protein